MISRRKLMWFVLLLVAVGLSGPDASAGRLSQGIASLRLPADIALSPVESAITVNGLRLEAAYIDSGQAVTDLIHKLRAHFVGELRQRRAGGWQVLSYRQGDYLLTIQVQPGPTGGSRGIIAISDLFAALAQAREASRPWLPIPPDTTILQQIGAKDLGASSRTLILLSQRPPEQLLAFYRRHFRGKGYEPVTRGALARVGSGGAMVLSRGSQQLNLSVSRRDGTTLVTLVDVRP